MRQKEQLRGSVSVNRLQQSSEVQESVDTVVKELQKGRYLQSRQAIEDVWDYFKDGVNAEDDEEIASLHEIKALINILAWESTMISEDEMENENKILKMIV